MPTRSLDARHDPFALTSVEARQVDVKRKAFTRMQRDVFREHPRQRLGGSVTFAGLPHLWLWLQVSTVGLAENTARVAAR